MEREVFRLRERVVQADAARDVARIAAREAAENRDRWRDLYDRMWRRRDAEAERAARLAARLRAVVLVLDDLDADADPLVRLVARQVRSALAAGREEDDDDGLPGATLRP